jgi:hypothetical protein
MGTGEIVKNAPSVLSSPSFQPFSPMLRFKSMYHRVPSLPEKRSS